MEKLVVIIGPTAVGKTEISVELALRLQGEIISGDSMQVYKYMDIGTAKIRPEESRGIPHHLLDIREPDQTFNVAEFQQLARQKISEINQRGKLPLLVGGTGLYVQAVLDDYEFGPAETDPGYRQKLREIARTKGEKYLHRQLQAVDPLAADRIHPNDIKRIIRALEYYHSTGKQISANSEGLERTELKRYNAVLIGLNMDRQKLYQRIEQRVDQMMDDGFLEEVRGLLARGYDPNLPSLQGLGYKQLISYLQGEIALETAVELIKRDTRRFAKRQLTWFRRDPRICWFNLDSYADKRILLEELLSIIGRSIPVNVE